MSTSIHLERLRVSGWKGIKEEVAIDFGPHSWLIHGPNESGKSSLFSALRFALFETAGTNGAWARGWVNTASTAAEVEVELRIDGRPFTIIKTRDRKNRGATELFEGTGAGRRRLERDKDAEQRIRDLLGASEHTKRGLEVPANWGILAWLLAPQSMDTVADARRHSTEALGLGKAISPQFQDVRDRVNAFVKDNFGKSGGALKNSEITGAQAPVDELEQEREEILAARTRFDTALMDIEAARSRIPDLERALSTADDAYEAKRAEDVSFATDEAALQAMRDSRAAALTGVQAAELAVAALAELDAEIAKRAGEERKLGRRVVKLESKEQSAALAQKAAAEAYDEALQQREHNHRTTELQRTWIAALDRGARIDELRSKLGAIEAVRREIDELAADGPVLDETTIDERLQLAADLEQAESLLANLASERGVAVSLQGELDATWLRDGEAVEMAESLDFASELQVKAQGFTLTVRFAARGGETDWLARRKELADRVSSLGVDDAAALRTAMLAQRTRTRVHEDACKRLVSLGDAGRWGAELEALQAIAPVELPGDVPAIETLKADVEARNVENEELSTRVTKLKAEQTDLERDRQALGKKLQAARTEHRSTVDRLADARGRRDRAIEQGGGAQTRDQASEQARRELRALDEKIAAADALLAMNKGAHGEELRRLRRVKLAAERDLFNCRTEVTVLRREADQLGGQDLHQRLLDVQASLHAARATLSRVRRRAEAMRRLSDRLNGMMTEATDIETGPVRERVQSWLRLITNGHWQRADMDSRLKVTKLEGAPPTIEGEAMGSAGLTQVLHALTRLAVAAKIHADGRARDPNYPAVALVMDESQSHVDDVRVRRLMHVFNQEIRAGHVQVMALSHRRDEFQNLQAMNYDIARREAYDPDAPL